MTLESDSLTLSRKELGGFLKEICAKGRSFKFTAKGMSMAPFICDGDALIIEPYSKRMELGDVVAFIPPGQDGLTIHRIIKRKREKFLLKGDNAYKNDGYFKGENIYGYVKKVIIMEEIALNKRKKCHINCYPAIQRVCLYLNNYKKIIALFSRYKILTPLCRIANKLL